MMSVPMRIAIIDNNVLTGIGLQHILKDIIPMAEIVVLHDFTDIEGTAYNDYAHFFVSSRIFFEHSQFFRQNTKKTIVLVSGDANVTGLRTLNICQDEKPLLRDILALHAAGHGRQGNTPPQSNPQLSAREAEVAVLLCKGYINKEIAGRLNISLTTVISHRRNIMIKLHARSLADIIIYSVMHGLVDVGEL